MAPRKKHLIDEDATDTQNGAPDEAKQASVVASIVSAVRSSRYIQIGILAILFALSIAIVRGNSVSMFGITIAKEQPVRSAKHNPTHNVDSIVEQPEGKK